MIFAFKILLLHCVFFELQHSELFYMFAQLLKREDTKPAFYLKKKLTFLLINFFT